jgi:hypothetical protein
MLRYKVKVVRMLQRFFGDTLRSPVMDFILEQIIPAIVMLVGNLFGSSHGSRRWEIVTALYGWTAGATALLILFLESAFYLTKLIDLGVDLEGGGRGEIRRYLLQLFAFSMLAALSRDYEKILFPFFKKGK